MGAPKEGEPAGATRPPLVPLEERVVFAQGFEALLHACGDPPRPEILAVFRDAGVDFAKLQVAYPINTHLTVLSGVRKVMYPDLSDDEAFYRLGRGFIDRYDTTLMGKALLRMLPVLGTRRVMGRLTQSFRTASNYVEAQSVERGPRDFEISIRPFRFSGFYRGILSAGLELTGAKGLKVEVLRVVGEEITFMVRWDG